MLEGGLGQSLPHPLAELPDRVGQLGEPLLPVRLRLELPRLFFEPLLTSFEVTPAAPVLVQRHHPGEIGLRQSLELLPQARLTAAQPLLARLEFLRQPLSAMRPRQGLGDLLGVAQQLAQVSQTNPSSLSAGLSRDGHFCSRCENKAGSLPVQE